MADKLPYVCDDCSAQFSHEEDADAHEESRDHTVYERMDPRDPRAQERRSRAIENVTPQTRRERFLDGQGPPRADY